MKPRDIPLIIVFVILIVLMLTKSFLYAYHQKGENEKFDWFGVIVMVIIVVGMVISIIQDLNSMS